jgi:hypothetical protein
MPKIHVILENEDGQKTQQTFDLPKKLDTLGEIDEAVEQFKNATLPQLEQQLFQESQERIVVQEKKTLAQK